MAAFSRAMCVYMQRSLARWTWAMEERERLEARRCGIRVSIVGDAERVEVEGWAEGGKGEWEQEEFEVIIIAESLAVGMRRVVSV